MLVIKDCSGTAFRVKDCRLACCGVSSRGAGTHHCVAEQTNIFARPRAIMSDDDDGDDGDVNDDDVDDDDDDDDDDDKEKAFSNR